MFLNLPSSFIIKFTKDENDPGVWRYVMQPDL